MDLKQILAKRLKVLEFQRKHRIGLVTLLFTDPANSTRLVTEWGDAQARESILDHQAVIRRILSAFTEGEEIEAIGESFYILFTRPSDAVRFSLMVQSELRQRLQADGLGVLVRIGIHVGEVFIDEAGGESELKDLYGIQVDTCARVMSLGQGDQVLMSRFVFDNARQVLKGQDLPGLEALSWLNHGTYQLKGVEEPVVVCEVGEAGRAVLTAPPDSEKASRHVAAGEEPVLGWRPAVGQVVPQTKWVLDRKLGEGGFGEVWLGRHEQLREERVFKFCFKADRVRYLKRELTLFKVMREQCGAHPRIVGVQEVNLEQAPYYLMMEYAPGRSLDRWVEEQGGLGAVSGEVKLEIAAQVAEALGAAHGAGVIHRDVKPGNILVEGNGREVESIRVKLTDFGVGRVVSEEILSGRTQGGLTKTLAGEGVGTPMYLAPEVMEGKAASATSDIYALGVVLFQMWAGTLKKAISIDWKRDVNDPLIMPLLVALLSADPEKRQNACSSLSSALREIGRNHRKSQEQCEAIERRAKYWCGLGLIGGIVGLAMILFIPLPFMSRFWLLPPSLALTVFSLRNYGHRLWLWLNTIGCVVAVMTLGWFEYILYAIPFLGLCVYIYSFTGLWFFTLVWLSAIVLALDGVVLPLWGIVLPLGGIYILPFFIVFLSLFSRLNCSRRLLVWLNALVISFGTLFIIEYSFRRASIGLADLLGTVVILLVCTVFGLQNHFSAKRREFARQNRWAHPWDLLKGVAIRKTAWMLAVGALIFIGYISGEKLFWSRKCDTLRRQLEAKGENLALRSLLRPPLTPIEQTNYQQFLAHANALPNILEISRCIPTTKERALPSWHSDVKAISPAKSNELHSMLKPYQTDFQRACELLASARFPFTYDDAFYGADANMKWTLASHLSFQNQQKLAAGEPAIALPFLERMITLVRLWQQIPTPSFSEQTCHLIDHVFEAIWETVAQNGLGEAELAKLQNDLRTLLPAEQGWLSLKIGAIRDLEFLRQCRNSRESLRQLTQRLRQKHPGIRFQPDEFEAFLCGWFYYPLWRYAFSYEDEYRCLEIHRLFALEKEALQLDHGSQYSPQKPFEQLGEQYENLQKSLGYFARYWQNLRVNKGTREDLEHLKRSWEAEMKLRIAVAAVAVQRYHRAHRTWPGGWQDLTPPYLPQAFLAKMSSSKHFGFVTNRLEPPLIYWTGWDGVDQEGWSDDIAWPLEGGAGIYLPGTNGTVHEAMVFNEAPLSNVIRQLAQDLSLEVKINPQNDNPNVTTHLTKVSSAQVLSSLLLNYNRVLFTNYRGLLYCTLSNQIHLVGTQQMSFKVAQPEKLVAYPWNMAETEKGDFDFNEADLATVIQSLCKISKINIIFDPQLMEDPQFTQAKVSLHKTNTTAPKICEALLQTQKMELLWDPNTGISRLVGRKL